MTRKKRRTVGEIARPSEKEVTREEVEQWFRDGGVCVFDASVAEQFAKQVENRRSTYCSVMEPDSQEFGILFDDLSKITRELAKKIDEIRQCSTKGESTVSQTPIIQELYEASDFFNRNTRSHSVGRPAARFVEDASFFDLYLRAFFTDKATDSFYRDVVGRAIERCGWKKRSKDVVARLVKERRRVPGRIY
jgi:hypothetical protein